MSGLGIRTLKPDDWREYREIRLAALADAPQAFVATLAQGEAMTERDWRARLEQLQVVAAQADGRLVGLAAGLLDRDQRVAELLQMWVAPEARGTGAVDVLLSAVAGWARGQGAEQLRAWVADGNGPAVRAYARHGFTPTGESQPMTGHPGAVESAMLRSLAAPVVGSAADQTYAD